MIVGVPPVDASIFDLTGWAARFALAGAVLVVALALFWGISWVIPRALARSEAAEGPRARQRQTAISALATSLRYLVLAAALSAIAFALAGGGGIAAISGGALVVVVASFASQRLLVDVIAGFFILFEDQYAIGDMVRLEPSAYTGTVLSLGLRTTVLRGPGGERMIIPNGQITAARIIPQGHRRHRLEFLTRDPNAVEATIHALVADTRRAGGPWTSEPRVVRHDGTDGIVRVIAILEVDVHREHSVAWLSDAVAGSPDITLVAPPLTGLHPGGR